MKYMIEFAFAHPYASFLIGGVVFVGARWALLKLKEALWKTDRITSHYDDKTGKLHVDDNSRRASDGYIIKSIVNLLNKDGANIRQNTSSGTGKKK